MTTLKIGETYPMRRGGSGTVESRAIHPDDDRDVFVVRFDTGYIKGTGLFNPNGHWEDSGDCGYDLLLPAIEAEGAPAARFLEPAIASLEAVRDAWDDFQKGVAADKLDPAIGGVCICGKMGLSIQCNYSGPSDAFDDAGRVIAAINSLLEGRSHD